MSAGKGKAGSVGGRTKKWSCNQDINDLTNFRFDRYVATSLSNNVNNFTNPNMSNSNTKNNRRKPRSTSVSSKSVFFQNNFRFILYPTTQMSDKLLHDPDQLPPWGSVMLILSTQQEPHVPTCPICLEHLKIPKVTKCGHSFCWTCVLQHMNSEYSTSQKCPICTEYICKTDLKSIQFINTATPAPAVGESFSFHLTSSSSGSIVSKMYTARDITTIIEPVTNQNYTSNSALHAVQSSSSSSSSSSRPQLHTSILPILDSSPTCYSYSKSCRILVASHEIGLLLYHQEKLNLCRFQQLCLDSITSASLTLPYERVVADITVFSSPSSSLSAHHHQAVSYDVEYLPYIAEAVVLCDEIAVSKLVSGDVHILAANSATTTTNNNNNNNSNSNIASKNKSSSGGKPWNNGNMGVSAASASKAIPTTVNSISSLETPFLPTIDQFLASIHCYNHSGAMINEFDEHYTSLCAIKQPSQQVAPSSSSNNVMTENTSIATASSYVNINSNNSSSNNIMTTNIEIDFTEQPHSTFSYYYQSIDAGDPVLLHPLCCKCIIASVYYDTLQQQQEQQQRQIDAARGASESHATIVTDVEQNAKLIVHLTKADEVIDKGDIKGKDSRSKCDKNNNNNNNSSGSNSSSSSSSSSSSGSSNNNNNNNNNNAEKFKFKDLSKELHKRGIHYLSLPLSLTATRVVEVEAVKVTEAMRSKIPFLRQYPEGSTVQLVEVDFNHTIYTISSGSSGTCSSSSSSSSSSNISNSNSTTGSSSSSESSSSSSSSSSSLFRVRSDVLRMFENEFTARATERRNRARVKVIQKQDEDMDRMIEWAQMASLREKMQRDAIAEMELLQQVKLGPKLGSSSSSNSNNYSNIDSNSDSNRNNTNQTAITAGGVGVGGKTSEMAISNVSKSITTAAAPTTSKSSFATITLMNGNFPGLVSSSPPAAAASASVTSGNSNANANGVWGHSKLTTTARSTSSLASQFTEGSTAIASSSWPRYAAIPTQAIVSVPSSSSSSSSASKKPPQQQSHQQRKKHVVSLLSNTSGRSYT